jgi:deazaflavin-dependent oxidoreductase (nitroreductase family)
VPRARTRKLNRFERALEKVAATRAGGWFFVNVAHHLDPFLLRVSKGRVSLAPGQPVALVTVKGAKSGLPRQTPLLFASDGADIVLLASNAGSARHPAWYHNLRANPEVDVIAPGGRSGRYLAHEADGPERERLWEIAADLYAGYDVYQGRAGERTIPVMVLSPVLRSP